MRSCICLLTLLGLFAFLWARYPLWMACGIIYFGGLLVVGVIAFATRKSQTKTSRNLVLDNKQCQDEQTVSKKLKAA